MKSLTAPFRDFRVMHTGRSMLQWDLGSVLELMETSVYCWLAWIVSNQVYETS